MQGGSGGGASTYGPWRTQSYNGAGSRTGWPNGLRYPWSGQSAGSATKPTSKDGEAAAGADGSLRPRFKCLEKDCRRRFSHNPGFIGKHHAPAVITDALDRYAGGMCAEAIVQNMRKNGIPVSERTLRRWFVEYRDLLERYIGSLTVQAGHTWHADEIQYRARNDDQMDVCHDGHGDSIHTGV